MTIAFDVDYTLINADNSPNYKVIDLLRWHLDNGDRVVIWSGGGVEYATTIARRLGLLELWNVCVGSKTLEVAEELGIDIAVDDEFVTLGKVNIKINNPTKKDGGPTNN